MTLRSNRLAPLFLACALGTLPGCVSKDDDGDGVRNADDPCSTTIASHAQLVPGCSATDFLLAPGLLGAPVGEGLDAFVADTADNPLPAEVAAPLQEARLFVASAAVTMRAAIPCDATTDFDIAQGWIDAGLSASGDHLAMLDESEPVDPTGGAAGAPENSPDGPIVPRSAEYLHWIGKHAELGEVLAEAETASALAAAVCQAEEGPVSVEGRIARFDETRRLVELMTGERILLGLGAQFENSPGEGLEVVVSGHGYSDGVTLGTAFEISFGQSQPYPGLYDGLCSELRFLPVQPIPSNPAAWIKHRPSGYERGSYHNLERGMRIGVEDALCPGVIPGGGPNGFDLDVRYFYKIELSYTDRDGNPVGPYEMAHELTGESNPIHLPSDVHPQVPAVMTVRKFKRVCEATGIRLPVVDPESGNLGELREVWSCDPDQQLGPNAVYLALIVDQGSYCGADFQDVVFDLDEEPQGAFRYTHVDLVGSLFLEPVVFSARGRKMVGPNPGPMQSVGVNEPFAIYRHGNGGSGTNHPSGLSWPNIQGTLAGSPFRYACGVPKIATDALSLCQGQPDTLYKLPFPKTRLVYTAQGNADGDEGSHNSDQAFALDLIGAPNDWILAARGGVVVKARTNWATNCIDNPCPDITPPEEYGSFVAIQHQDGDISWYMHLQANTSPLQENDVVQRGDFLGLMGTTGRSFAPHVHFHVTGPDPNFWYNSTKDVRYEVLVLGQGIGCQLPLEGQFYLSSNGP